MDKSTLEASSRAYNSLMGWATIAVAVGIGGEYIAHFFSNKEKRWWRAVTLLFALCVLLGVVGEWWFGKKLSDVADQIQLASDKDVFDATNRLTTAEGNLAVAIRDSGAAKQAASEAYERAAKANERAIANEKEAARLSKEAAEARQKEAQAELQLVRLRKNQMVRNLPGEIFEKALQGKPIAKVQLMYMPDNGETYQFAQSIFVGLFSAGWKPFQPVPIPSDLVREGMRDLPPDVLRRFPPTVRAGGQPTGISIVARKIDWGSLTTDTPGGALSEAFLACGFDIGSGRNTDIPPDLRYALGSGRRRRADYRGVAWPRLATVGYDVHSHSG